MNETVGMCMTEPAVELTDEEKEMMNVMGFYAFSTTKVPHFPSVCRDGNYGMYHEVSAECLYFIEELTDSLLQLFVIWVCLPYYSAKDEYTVRPTIWTEYLVQS